MDNAIFIDFNGTLHTKEHGFAPNVGNFLHHLTSKTPNLFLISADDNPMGIKCKLESHGLDGYFKDLFISKHLDEFTKKIPITKRFLLIDDSIEGSEKFMMKLRVIGKLGKMYHSFPSIQRTAIYNRLTQRYVRVVPNQDLSTLIGTVDGKF